MSRFAILGAYARWRAQTEEEGLSHSGETIDETYGRHHAIDRPGCQIHYWLRGSADAPLVALSHAALVDHTFFAKQMAALVPHFRVLS